MDLKETDILGAAIDQHWYYRAKARAMRQLLGAGTIQTVLDVGAGSGFFSRHLLAQTAAQEAWCVDISYSADSDASEAGKPVHFRRAIAQVAADLVLMMDVLEHVDDDVGLLRDYVDKVPSGCRFLLSVPAFQFLWSSHDVFLEHKRRYRLAELEHCAQHAGLDVLRGAYGFGAIFPLAASLRTAERLRSPAQQKARSQLKIHHPLSNWLLGAACALEQPFLPHNRWFGLTAFCLAKKP